MIDTLNWADYFILCVLVISSLFGFMRGMFKEVLSLLTWVSAFIIAQLFWPPLDQILTPYMEGIPSIRAPLAWGLLFICAVFVGSLIQRLILELVRVTGLSGTDRALGGIFGLLRGVVIIVLLLTFAPLIVDFSQDDWWNESQLFPIFFAINDSVMLSIESLIGLVTSLAS